MVKIYESAYTYLPFIYMYLSATMLGSIYHSNDKTLVHYRPYTVLIALLVNTAAHRFYKNPLIIRTRIHKITWKSVTMITYGVIGNLIHEMVFTDHHFDQYHHNVGWSFLYTCLAIFGGYWLKSDGFQIMLHLAFLLIPIKREWQVNLYLFTLYVSCSIYMIYSKYRTNDQSTLSLHYVPLLRYFQYLRIQDELIVIGVLQLYIEYYQRYIPEMRAAEDIEAAMRLEEFGLDTPNDASDVE